MTAKKKRAAATPAPTAKKKTAAKPSVPSKPDAKSSPALAAPAPSDHATPQKFSALDAAAQVLRENDRPMSCTELIEQMAAKDYWASPKGKTPSSTLYAALAREVQLKGEAARFVKTGPGRFAYRDPDATRP
jgi:hypothetical protein